ncbi:MAG: hypothetical protein EPO32_13340 [Anaerolineae bacterium]|nr:MAG: hypothetical protein EPO32_13340 [Anaerolineae bacterium]
MADSPRGQQFLLTEDVVRPGAVESYEAAMLAFRQKVTEHAFDVPYQLTAMENHSHFVMSPIDQLAGIDAMTHAYDRLADQIGLDSYMATMRKSFEAMDHQNHSVVYRHEALAYHPDGRPSFGEQPYTVWRVSHIQPSRNEQALAALAELAALLKKRSAPLGQDVYTRTLGPQMPAFLLVTCAPDAAAHAARQAETRAALGGAGEKLWARLRETLRASHTFSGHERPDLSYLK